MSRSLAAAGATFRIARRDAWRNKARSSLVAVMVALPILAASTVSVLYQSDSTEPRDLVALQLGSAQAQVNWYDESGPTVQDLVGGNTASQSPPAMKLTTAEFEQKLRAALPAGDRIADRTVLYDQLVGFGDRALTAGVVEFDYASLPSGGPLEQISGRAPAAADEVVVTRSMQRKDGVQAGDRLSWKSGPQAAAKDYTVVGVVGGMPVLGAEQLIGLPGALLPPVSKASGLAEGGRETSWFVAGGAPVTWDDVVGLNQLGATVLSRDVVQNPQTATIDPSLEDAGAVTDGTFLATGAVVVLLVLLQIALMAGPAIAVGTRRNERGLAVVAATGGEGRHLRSVVLVGSALIGLVSSVAAAALGAGLAAVMIPVLRSHWEIGFARTDIHLGDLAVLVVVGTLTTLAAALLPARRVARIDIVAALTGRRPQAVPRLRVPLTGLVLVLGGLTLAWFAAGRAEQFPAVLGLGLAEVGLVVASPAVVGLAARLSARTSFASRFAFRDAARQRGRTAPAVAAVLAAVAGGMTALVFVSASTEADRANYTSQVPAGVVDVGLDLYRGTYSPDDAAVVTSSLRQSLPVRDLAVVQEVPSDDFVTVQKRCAGPTVLPDGTYVSGPDGGCEGTGAWFASTDAAAVFGSGRPGLAAGIRAALTGGKVAVFDPAYLDPDGTVRVQVSRSDSDSDSPVVRLPGMLVGGDRSLSTPLIPARLAKTLGVTLLPSHVIADTTRAVGEVEQERAQQTLRRTGLSLGLSVERGYEEQLELIVLAYLIAAALVALIGTFTAVGLAAAESRADLGTLAAVGAAPGMRRRLGAAQAGAIVVPGTLLGLVSGTAAGWVLIRLNVSNNVQWEAPGSWHYTIPWEATAALGLGIPALAIAVGFLTVRSRLVLVRRLGE